MAATETSCDFPLTRFLCSGVVWGSFGLLLEAALRPPGLGLVLGFAPVGVSPGDAARGVWVEAGAGAGTSDFGFLRAGADLAALALALAAVGLATLQSSSSVA